MSYIGKAPGFGIRNRYYYTATASQTLFSGADDNGQTLAYADSKYLDVYLNGVSLVAGTDYTATTLTSVTLTSGAAASDIVEIVAYDIFSVADTVSASNGGTFDGAVTFADSITVDNDGGVVAYFNRATTDGAIAIFQKDGSNVGVIGSADSGDRVYLANGGLEGVGVDNGSNALLPTSQVGADKDNHLDLGTSSSRFKDLYLSGGAYLGGTTSTNYLDDYEEGEFSGALTINSGTVTLDTGSDTLEYTKIGRVVTITGLLRVDSVSSPSGAVSISLPFAVGSVVGSGVENTARSFVGFNVSNNLNANEFVLVAAENESNANIFNASGTSLSTTNVGESFKANSTIAINFSYRVA